MFKIAFATATAVLVAATFGASAHAGGPRGSGGVNGTSLNGMSINGMGINGMSLNAITGNGMSLNGITANGWQNGIELNGTAPAASSFAIDGIELPAQVR